MKRFEKPNYTITNLSEATNYGRFVIEPLERGFGTTLGNALRRVLLSSLPGAAIFSVEIEKVRHEFSAIDGIEEDVTAIVLNLKDLVLTIDDEAGVTKKLTIEVEGPHKVTGADVACPAGVEVVNKDLHICNVAEGVRFAAVLSARNGRGYVTAENNKTQGFSVGIIPTDSMYTPVTKVAYEIEPTRVGHDASYERLIIEVWTNGGVAPQEAMAIAARILIAHLDPIVDLASQARMLEVLQEPVYEEENLYQNKTIEELELSVRSLNCLKRAKITTVEELTQKTEEEMMKIRNLGKKSLKEVKDVLQSLGLSFKSYDE